MTDTATTTIDRQEGGAGPGDLHWFAGALAKVNIRSEDTGGTMSMLEWDFPDEWATPVHIHEHEDQTIHVLAGRLVAWLDPDGENEVELTLEQGDSVFLPRRIAHTFRTDAPGTRILEINTPGGFEGFHIDAGDPAPARRLPEPGPPDVERLARVAPEYGGAILGPPKF